MLLEHVEIVQIKDVSLPATVQQAFAGQEPSISVSQHYAIYTFHLVQLDDAHIDALHDAYTRQLIAHWSYRDATAYEYPRAITLLSENTGESAPALRFSWRKIIEQWPYLVEQPEGKLTGVLVADEPSRLFLASVLQRENRWEASLLLDGVHAVRSPFLTCEEAQKEAERALTDSLRTCGLLEDASPLVSCDNDPFYEVAALLTIILDAEMHISHLSEYKRTWVAVCISQDGTRLEDYIFTRDSDGVLGTRLRMNRLEVRC